MTSSTPTDGELRVVSISLGSSSGNKTVQVTLAGRPITIERRGVDGDLQRMLELFGELDGQVDAFGLGGMDLYLVAGDQRYLIRDAARVAAAAKVTPLLDGSGLKHTLERETIRRIDAEGLLPIRGRRVLLVCGVDRFGMAEALHELTDKLVFGDLMFGLGLPLPVRSYGVFRRLARMVLPVLVRLPFKVFYPTGSAQRTIRPKFGKAYAEAEIICGDFHFIRRHLPPPGDPPPLAGKAVITNTTTSEDLELLRERGLATLVTTTPEFDGRTFGTNVMEAALTALNGGVPPTQERMWELLSEVSWRPNVVHLQDPDVPDGAVA